MKVAIHILVLFVGCSAFAQISLNNLLKKYNDNSIPYISVEELAMPKSKVILLDAREQKEYKISHIKEAIYIGHDAFKIELVESKITDKNTPIVVYCSLGIRSESIADSLNYAGYNNVRNLYGGIFEWKNKGFPVYNSKEKETDSIHAFSEEWGKWLTNGIKVYD